MISYSDAKALANLLKMFGDPTRLLLLDQLIRGPAHVTALAEAVGVSVVNVSGHLTLMRHAGLLDHRRRGRFIVYSIKPGLLAPGGPGTIGTLTLGPYRLVLLAPGGPLEQDGRDRATPDGSDAVPVRPTQPRNATPEKA